MQLHSLIFLLIYLAMNPSEDDKKEHCMKVKLRNRLEVLMKDNGVSTFEEMAERMTNNQN